ncbi:MAG: hypothetical protein K6G52_04405 [Treponemataceae bacterium]|nr:hypothetical protein [Treponemataceae bacterium]
MSSLYPKVKMSLRKNYSFSLLSLFALFFLINVSYFALGFFSVLFMKIPFMAYPLIYLFTYVITTFIFGFFLLTYLLSSNQRGVIGHLLYFFREKRMFLISLFYLAAFIILLLLSFLPYVFFADRALDKEIYALILDANVEAIMNLDHGFSIDFMLSVALWIFLDLAFLFSFAYLPIYLYTERKEKFFVLIKKSVKSVYSHYFSLLGLVLHSIAIPFLVFAVGFAIDRTLVHFDKFKMVSETLRFIYPVGLIFVALYSVFAISVFFEELSSSKETEFQPILLLPPPCEVDKE